MKIALALGIAATFLGVGLSRPSDQPPQPAPEVAAPEMARQLPLGVDIPQRQPPATVPCPCCGGSISTQYTLRDGAVVVTMNFVGAIGDKSVFYGFSGSDTYVLTFCTTLTTSPDNTLIYLNVYPISSGRTTTSPFRYVQNSSPFGGHAIVLTP